MRSVHRDLGGDQFRFGLGGDGFAAGLEPVGREEFVDALVGVIGQARDEVDQIGLGIGADEPAVLGQGEEIGQTGAGVGVADEQPVSCADLERADRACYPEEPIMPSWRQALMLGAGKPRRWVSRSSAL